jgi:hypothetical protein
MNNLKLQNTINIIFYYKAFHDFNLALKCQIFHLCLTLNDGYKKSNKVLRLY